MQIIGEIVIREKEPTFTGLNLTVNFLLKSVTLSFKSKY